MALPKNQKDPLFLIIEAAYCCGDTVDQIHATIAAHGLDQTSDETIMMMLGEYADSIED